MELNKIDFKTLVNKNADSSLSFRYFDLTPNFFERYATPHKKDHFCVFMVQSGSMALHIEEKTHWLKKGKISVTFPDQVQFVSDISPDLSGKVILFEEVLFCSDILKNELSSYNVNLTGLLSCLFLSEAEFGRCCQLAGEIKEVYEHPSLVKKEQARFYIKILLLGLIEMVHGQQPVIQQEADKPHYIRFKELLNAQYKSQRTVQYYAAQLSLTPKKLNEITKKHCGETAINAIHNRILTEIKRLMLFSDYTHKEIAFDLGFSSPSALNKFVRSKLHETPSELQQELEQIYTT